MSRRLEFTDFTAHLQSTFRVAVSPEQSVELLLTAAEERPSTPHQEQFAVYFRGPLDCFLPQRTYQLEHDRLGSLELFLVPVGRGQAGFTYEAFFNRFRGEKG